jgi:hypothetical protein
MTTKQLIEDVRLITMNNLELIRKKISFLNEDQKSWKINQTTWSINEIFAHMNDYAKFYHSTFLERIEKTRFREPNSIFMSSPLGRSAWKSMKLGNAKNVKRKFKSPKANNPSLDISLLTGNEVSDFEKGQVELLSIIEKATTVNLRKVKVPISISKLIRFRLGDALMFVVYHNERHVQQVLNVMAHPKFPKK